MGGRPLAHHTLPIFLFGLFLEWSSQPGRPMDCGLLGCRTTWVTSRGRFLSLSSHDPFPRPDIFSPFPFRYRAVTIDREVASPPIGSLRSGSSSPLPLPKRLRRVVTSSVWRKRLPKSSCFIRSSPRLMAALLVRQLSFVHSLVSLCLFSPRSSLLAALGES